MRTMLLVAGACLIGGTVEAQGTERRKATAEEERRAERAVTVMRDGVMQSFVRQDSAAMNRATLGLMLGGSPNKRDTLGVFVEGVAEDGPAERAGIFEGHRIAAVNGVDVRASAADAGDAYLSGVGQHRLMRAMRDVSAGSTVTLRVWNGSGYRDVQVMAARYADVFKGERFGFFRSEGFPGGMSFGPALGSLRMHAPDVRHFEMVRPSEPSRPKVRATPAPRAPRKVRTTVSPTTRIEQFVPAVVATPRAVSVPMVAPAPTTRRRYTI